MTSPTLLGALLVAAVVLAIVRLVVRFVGAPRAERPYAWRLAVLIALQPVSAALLWLTLMPPPLSSTSGNLVVATRGTNRIAALAANGALVALPEAPALPGAEAVPDLATALRRHGGTTMIHVIGEGLEPRDRDSARGLGLSFDPPPLPRGLVRLDPPGRVAPGDSFHVGGRVAGVGGGQVELVDPAGRRVDAAPIAADGEFSLSGSARGAGLTAFALRVRSADHALIEEADVPVAIVADPQPRLLLLAGAPGPEVKYLRRWASDAGMALVTRMGTGGGIELGDTPVVVDAATLRRFDLAVVDERSWAALGAGERAALIKAVRDGLGLVLRVTGPIPADVSAQWQALGWRVAGGAESAPVAISNVPDNEEAMAPQAANGRAPSSAADRDGGVSPPLIRRVVSLHSADAAPLLRGDHGEILAIWRAEGRGRTAVWTLADSYGLTLTGHGDRFGEIWGKAFALLGRGQGVAAPDVAPGNRAGERAILCGIATHAHITAPDGTDVALLPDQGHARCAAYWPQKAGWHLIHQPLPDGTTRISPFFVIAQDGLPAMRAAEARSATMALIGPATARQGDGPVEHGPAWPWFIGWLAASSLLWWFERSRLGRRAGPEVLG